MREASRDKGRLEHILSAIDKIMNYVATHSKETIRRDPMVYYGIVKHIEIIGEAAFMLTSDFRDSHPQTPWSIITKMRHVLVHDYYQIDEEEVWYVVEDDLPILRPQIVQYIQELERA